MRKGDDEQEQRSLAQRGLNLLVGGFAEKSGLWRLRGWFAPAEYFRFLARHPRRLGFCLLWTAASGFGQTFFLSLFQPHWIESLALTSSSMGLLYGVATLLSASLLGKLGAWLDATDQRAVAIVAASGLALGCALAALAPHWSLLFLAVALLRFFGQGLSAMLGTTSAARWFRSDQSKAVSVAGLGYPLGEAILPTVVVASIVGFGWRTTAWASSAFVLFLALPLGLALLGRRPPALRKDRNDALANDRDRPEDEPPRRSLYREPLFFMTLAVTCPLPFFATGIIFFQSALGEQLDWTPKAFAAGFFCFALVRAAFSLGIGALADRIGPMRLLGSPLIFFSGGLFLLAAPGSWTVYAFFVCMGLAFGVAGAITTPVWGELFGIARLGAARGASASVTVFATALSPALFGFIIEAGHPARGLLLVSGTLLLLVFWPISIRVRRRHEQAVQAAR